MDVIDSFLKDNTTPERHELLMDTYNTLVTLGHVNHELNIQNFVNIEGSLDNSNIVMLVENELLQACHELTISYYIVCRKEQTLKPYLNLFDVLTYLENTIESETLLYHKNDELDAREQFISWVDVFRNDVVNDISDLVLDVMDSLIDNITEHHLLNMDVTAVEPDVLYNTKIQYLKSLRDMSSGNLLAVMLIKKSLLNETYSVQQLYSKYNQYVYAEENDNNILAQNIISLTIMSNNDISLLAHDARTLVNLLYDDVKKTNEVINNIDNLLRRTGDIWKTMNTI